MTSSNSLETTFLIVRHGETTWNQIGRIQGQKNSPLNEEGLAQAQALARALGQWQDDFHAQDQHSITQLISSDLGRTLETAAPIATALQLTAQLDVRLRERAFGMFEGMTREQMPVHHAEAYAGWQSREPAYRIPGGESLNDLNARLSACLNDLAHRFTGETVCVVTHGGVLDSLYRLATQTPMQAPRTWTLSNASINTLFIDANGQWRVGDWGDVRHLATSEDERFV